MIFDEFWVKKNGSIDWSQVVDREILFEKSHLEVLVRLIEVQILIESKLLAKKMWRS